MNKVLRLPASLTNLEDFLSFIKEQAQKYGLSYEKINKLELASEEALVNIIKHAYPSKDGYIEIRCKSNKKSFIVEIIDKGIPFNPLSVKGPKLDVDIDSRPIGGVGILLIKKMTDFIEYERNNNGNLLRLAMHA